MARLTLWGMYQYDSSLFDDILLPQGFDKDALIAAIMRTSGELYPYHQVPPVLKTNITYWFKTREYDFAQMCTAMHVQYSPIENYDRTEERSLNLTHSGTDTDTTTLGSKLTVERTGSETSKTTGTDVSALGVSAYDSSQYQPREESTRTPNLTDTRTPNLTDTSTNSGTDKRETAYGHSESTTESIRAHGNIGVTTNQQMITAEIEMRMQLDLYRIITQLFEAEFLSQVYS